jgi:hypothetical protein
MKLAIFGDSYADADLFEGNLWSTNFSWPKLLKDYYKDAEVDFYGTSGTSSYWSYELFHEHHKKYTHVIFCYAGTTRWPYLPPEYTGRHFDIHGNDETVSIYKNQGNDAAYVKDLSRIFDTLFPQSFLNYINNKIFDDVNNTCKYNDIKLINIITTAKECYHIRDYYDFPVLENLIEVSANETVTVNDKTFYMHDIMQELGQPDIRYCHLNPHNNLLLSQVLVNLFTQNCFSNGQNKVMNKKVECIDLVNWQFTHSLIDEYYQLLLK